MFIKRWFFVGLMLALVAYFFYEAQDLLFAPELIILEPQNFSELSTGRIHIAGRTEPHLAVWISDRKTQSDRDGFFEDTIPAWPGYNEIGIKVSDKFGNETNKILKIVVK